MVRWTLGPLVLVTALAGCAASGSMRLFVNPDADMSFYKKVAVVPFANLTAEHFASERVERQFYTELVIAHRFQLVEDGEFRKAIDKNGATPDAQGQLDVEKVKQAAVALGVNG